MRSESCSFIWHPKVRNRRRPPTARVYRADDGRLLRKGKPRSLVRDPLGSFGSLADVPRVGGRGGRLDDLTSGTEDPADQAEQRADAPQPRSGVDAVQVPVGPVDL